MVTGRVGGTSGRCVVDGHGIEPLVRRRIRQFCQIERPRGEVSSVVASHVRIHVELARTVGEGACVGWIRAAAAAGQLGFKRTKISTTYVYHPCVC